MKIKLISNAILAMLLLSANLHAQKGKDPYVKGNVIKTLRNVGETKTNTISTVFELFSVSTQEAGYLMRENLSDKDLYTKLLESGKLESVSVIRSRSGESARSESKTDIIYPTEYESAQIPHTIYLNDTKAAVPKKVDVKIQEDNKKEGAVDTEDIVSVVVPALPRAFQAKPVGLISEIEVIVGVDAEGVELCNINVEVGFSSYIGERECGQGVCMTTQPMFESQNLALTLTSYFSKPCLLGTMNPAPSLKSGEGFSERVWFAMMTVKTVSQ